MTPAEDLAAKKKKLRPEEKVPKFRCLVLQKREELGLSQRNVANAIGMSDSLLTGIERGSNLTLTTAFALAEFFGCTIYDLWPEQLVKKGKAK